MQESRQEEIREYYKQIKNSYFKESINAISRTIDDVVVIIKKDAQKGSQSNKLVEEILQELLNYAKLNLAKSKNNELLSKETFKRNVLGFKVIDKNLVEAKKQAMEQLKKAQIVLEIIEYKIEEELNHL
tara:strand:+ start:940 stop:1326 length:387 start_codon:yes stop_codon:yes gene_type:complete